MKKIKGICENDKFILAMSLVTIFLYLVIFVIASFFNDTPEFSFFISLSAFCMTLYFEISRFFKEEWHRNLFLLFLVLVLIITSLFLSVVANFFINLNTNIANIITSLSFCVIAISISMRKIKNTLLK